MSKKENSILTDIRSRQKRKKEFLNEGMISAALIDSGGILAKAARLLGCSSSTLKNRIKESPRLQEIKRSSEELILDRAEEALFDSIDKGDMSSVRWLLARKGKDRGYSTQHEVTGKDGAPLFEVTEEDKSRVVSKFLKVSEEIHTTDEGESSIH